MWKTIYKKNITLIYLLKNMANEQKHKWLCKSSFNLWRKKYLINELSNEIKESIKVLQIAETQIKMHQDTLKLLSISRNSLVNQLREKLKNQE